MSPEPFCLIPIWRRAAAQWRRISFVCSIPSWEKHCRATVSHPTQLCGLTPCQAVSCEPCPSSARRVREKERQEMGPRSGLIPPEAHDKLNRFVETQTFLHQKSTLPLQQTAAAPLPDISFISWGNKEGAGRNGPCYVSQLLSPPSLLCFLSVSLDPQPLG